MAEAETQQEPPCGCTAVRTCAVCEAELRRSRAAAGLPRSRVRARLSFLVALLCIETLWERDGEEKRARPIVGC